MAEEVIQEPTGQPEEGFGGEGQTTEAEREPINLYELDEFKAFQAAQDRQMSQLRRDLEARDKQLVEMQAQLEESVLSDAPPEQRATYYEGRAAQLKNQLAQAEQSRQERDYYTNKATQTLQRLGLSWNTPGLDQSGGPTAAGYERLVESAAHVLAQQRGKLQEGLSTKQQETQRKLEQAQAMPGAQVSIATGGERESDIDALWAEYNKKRNALKRSGKLYEALKLKREYAKKGLPLTLTGPA